MIVLLVIVASVYAVALAINFAQWLGLTLFGFGHHDPPCPATTTATARRP